MKFFVKPVTRTIQYVSFNRNNELEYRFKDSIFNVDCSCFTNIKHEGLNRHPHYMKYKDRISEALSIKEDLIKEYLEKSVLNSHGIVSVDDIVKLSPKYGNLSKGRVIGIGMLYHDFSLEPIDDFCIEVTLLKKDGSDSQYTGFVTNTGFAIHKARKVSNSVNIQYSLPLMKTSNAAEALI